jgi:hypothetical protein
MMSMAGESTFCVAAVSTCVAQLGMLFESVAA